MKRVLQGGLIGAIAGGIATVPMTACMLAAQRMGFPGEAPPRLITDFALQSAGLRIQNKNEKTAVAGSVHFGFGIICGALFGALSRAGKSPSRIIQGILFGLLVWLVSYKGWVPALNIMPEPEDDRHDCGACRLWFDPGVDRRPGKTWPLIRVTLHASTGRRRKNWKTRGETPLTGG